jgi:hypothetical protein
MIGRFVVFSHGNQNSTWDTKAPFTLRSIFGTVPLFYQKSGTGTNFIRAVPKIV